MTFEGCFTIKLSAKIVVFYKNDTCRRIFYPIAAGPRTLPDGNPCKSRAPQGGIRQNPARIPQAYDRSPKSSANENGINGQPAMFHRKHSAGTKQKDKFRHRKAIHRIVSRPHNLKFPGGHDAFTNYFYNFVFTYYFPKSFCSSHTIRHCFQYVFFRSKYIKINSTRCHERLFLLRFTGM